MPPKISVVTTFYNYGKYLSQCIESVLNQTENDFEFILYDDGSTDNSLEIAMSYLKDSRLIVVETDHKGRALALANAMLETTGKYVGWLDADDWLHPNCFELMGQFLDNHANVGLIYSQYYDVNEQGKNQRLGHKCLVPYMGKDTLLLAFMVFHFRLFRREIYFQVGGIDINLKAAIDYDFCLKVSEVCNFYHLKQPLYYYRIHPASMSNVSRVDQNRCAQISKKNALRRRGYL